MATNGVISQLMLVATANEHPPGLVALTVAVEWKRKAAVQKLNRDSQLVGPIMTGKRLIDQLTLNAPPDEVPSNPLIPPLIQQAPILNEPSRIASIINKALLL